MQIARKVRDVFVTPLYRFDKGELNMFTSINQKLMKLNFGSN
jgi:hypothetical protein